MLVGAEGKQMEEIKNILVNGCEELDFVVDIDKNQLAFIKFVSDTTNEYQSPIEYAEFIKQMVYEETGINIKIAIGSTANSIVQASLSFSHAVWAFRMNNTLGAKGDIHSYKEYVLIKMLEDLPKYKLNEYLEMLMDTGAKEIFSDEEMTNTAEEFLENSLNVSETARKLYMHRNTLTYRLDKIERATGLNIRKFSDAVTFRLITILSKLLR
jgi:carbohydrate diacid regulator